MTEGGNDVLEQPVGAASDVKSAHRGARTLMWISGVCLWALAAFGVYASWKSNQQRLPQDRDRTASLGTQGEGLKRQGLEPIVLDPVEQPAVDSDTPWNPAGVQDFSLTERSGRPVTKQDLLGRPWAVCFVFSRCAGSCLEIMARMHALQEATTGSDVRLVSLSVDPVYDTPEQLRKYADAFGAEPDRWLLLTGDQERIYRLIQQSFLLPVHELTGEDRRPGFEILHSNFILHVNAKGVVVGKYDGMSDVEMLELRQALLKEAELLSGVANSGGAGSAQPAAEPAADHEADAPGWVLALPTVNAALNGLACVLLLTGFALVRRGNVTAHKCAMLSAFAVSVAFLACYLTYHVALKHYTGASSKPFPGTGAIRPVYYTILVSHVVLAVPTAVMALVTLRRGLRAGRSRPEEIGDLNVLVARHRRIARITFPIWVYVSVTGVMIYLMLYQWN